MVILEQEMGCFKKQLLKNLTTNEGDCCEN